MSGKQKLGTAHGDYEYLRSAQIERAEMQNEHGVVVMTAISLVARIGVVSIELSAYDINYDFGDNPLAVYRVEWPNATTMSFTATVFNGMVRLHALVNDSRLSDFMASSRAH